MTYKFQRNTPMYIPVVVFTFVSWTIFAIGFGCGKLCENAKAKKEKEKEILLQKEINKIA
jgi:hypothetical protein